MGHSFAEMLSLFRRHDAEPEGFAVDKKYPDIIYVPEDATVRFAQAKNFLAGRQERNTSSNCCPEKFTSGRPATRCGWKSPARTAVWRLVGTVAEGMLCHKPCTVSGGGKSEISKPITDAILTGPVFVADFKKDFDKVAELIERDYGGRFKDPARKD